MELLHSLSITRSSFSSTQLQTTLLYGLARWSLKYHWTWARDLCVRTGCGWGKTWAWVDSAVKRNLSGRPAFIKLAAGERRGLFVASKPTFHVSIVLSTGQYFNKESKFGKALWQPESAPISYKRNFTAQRRCSWQTGNHTENILLRYYYALGTIIFQRKNLPIPRNTLPIQLYEHYVLSGKTCLLTKMGRNFISDPVW